MQSFTSIDQFRQVVTRVRNFCNSTGKPLPTWTFTGRPKLHGTNAGIRRPVKGGPLRPQSRNNVLSVDSDNAGFAAFVERNQEVIRSLFDKTFGPDSDITVFGEWCGGNIQDRVALNQCPKHFVVFGAWNHAIEAYVPVRATTSFVDHGAGVYHITEVPEETLTIDFNQPHLVQDVLAELVERYEARCPWATFMGAIPTEPYEISQDVTGQISFQPEPPALLSTILRHKFEPVFNSLRDRGRTGTIHLLFNEEVLGERV